jgi:hypothetical protein
MAVGVSGLVGSFGNASLLNFDGLQNLTSIGGYIDVVENESLTSFEGLNNLTSIGGGLSIRLNDALTSLTGLDSINPGSIEDLSIHNNESLSTCDIYSVCEYLIPLGGESEIYDNAIGCNSAEEVKDSCGVWPGVKEFNLDASFSIYPNPLESKVIITYNLQQSTFVTLKILDLSGREMSTIINELQKQGEQQIVFNTTQLPAGIYFCVLKTRDGIQTKKIIKLD